MNVVAWTCVALGVASALIVVFDIVRGHHQHMVVMNLVWPLTALYSSASGGDEGRFSYLAGPGLDVRVWRGLRGSAALLFGAAPLPEGTARPTVHRWELPVTACFGLGPLPGRPYLRAGVSWNRVIPISGARGDPQAELRHRGTHGPVAGAGLELGRGRIKITPEVRLVRWIDRNFGVRDSSIRSNLTEVQLLAGVRF